MLKNNKADRNSEAPEFTYRIKPESFFDSDIFPVIGFGGFFCVSEIFKEVFMAAIAQPTSEILSRKLAAQFLGVCVTTLDRLDIPRTKVRRRVLYRKITLDNWLMEKEKQGGERESIKSTRYCRTAFD
jgi:hypothetical protein